MLLYFLCAIVGCDGNLDKFLIPNLVKIEWVRIWNPVFYKIRLLREVDQGKRDAPVDNGQIMIVDNIDLFVDLLEYFVPFWLDVNLFCWDFFHQIEHLNARTGPDVNMLFFLRVNLYYRRLEGETSLLKLKFTVISTWI